MRSGTTLFIHGGCHGAWCWAEVIKLLESRGVAARSFDLPGCGEDLTPRASVTLDSQVASVVDQVDAVPAGQIRLVGHSIAGWLLPAVAAARPERISELVFLAAAVLTAGESGIDVTPADRRPAYFELAAGSPDNSLMISFESAWERFFQHLDEAAARAAYGRLTPQPFQPYLDPALVGIENVGVARRYIAAADDRTYPADVNAEFARKADIEREVIAGDHCTMLSAPQVVASALI